MVPSGSFTLAYNKRTPIRFLPLKIVLCFGFTIVQMMKKWILKKNNNLSFNVSLALKY